MILFKSYYNILATTIFIVAILFAHLLITDKYNWTQNTISDLGAQGYKYKYIMQTGFLLFGTVLATGIFFNGLSWRVLPILIYGIAVAFTGIFCTKPFSGNLPYSIVASNLHSTFAQVAGIAFSIGILIQLFFTTDINTKYLHIVFFLFVIGLSSAFGLVKNYQGIIQRLLYLVSFIWLMRFYKP